MAQIQRFEKHSQDSAGQIGFHDVVCAKGQSLHHSLLGDEKEFLIKLHICEQIRQAVPSKSFDQRHFYPASEFAQFWLISI